MQLYVICFIPVETTVCIKGQFYSAYTFSSVKCINSAKCIFVSVPVVLLTKTEDDVHCSSF